MLTIAIRWVIFIAAIFALGPAAAWLTSGLRAADGSAQTSLLLAASPLQGILAGLGALVLAALAGVAAARFIGHRSGLFVAGLVLGWAAWGLGRIDRIIGHTLSAGALYTIAVEGVLFGLLGVVLAWIILRIPSIPRAAPVRAAADDHHHHHLPPEPRELWNSAAPAAILTALVAASIVVYLLAQDAIKGQTIAAAAMGGIFAAAAGRVVSQRLSSVTFFAALALLSAAAPLAASIIAGPAVVKAALSGTFFNLARPLPLDYLAGAFIGIPIGLSWAGSMLERHTPAASSAPGLAARP